MSPQLEAPIIFECRGEKLVGVLHPGNQDAEVGVAIVVGGPQYRVGSHRQFVLMARAFAAAGYPVLRFDYRGMGDSDGAPRTFENVDEDVRAAMDRFASAVPDLTSVVLLGLCDAASASLMYSAGDARVSGLILLNPWVRTAQGEARSYLRHYYVQRLMKVSLWRKIFKREFELRRSLNDLVQFVKTARGKPRDAGASVHEISFIERMQRSLERFARPVLFIISGRDLTAQEFVALCKDSKPWRASIERSDVVMRVLPDADHTTSSIDDLSAACEEIISWLDTNFSTGRFEGGYTWHGS